MGVSKDCLQILYVTKMQAWLIKSKAIFTKYQTYVDTRISQLYEHVTPKPWTLLCCYNSLHCYEKTLHQVLQTVTKVSTYFGTHCVRAIVPPFTDSWDSLQMLFWYPSRWRRCCMCSWFWLCLVWAREKREPVCWPRNPCWTAMPWRAVTSPCSTTSTMWDPGEDYTEW